MDLVPLQASSAMVLVAPRCPKARLIDMKCLENFFEAG